MHNHFRVCHTIRTECSPTPSTETTGRAPRAHSHPLDGGQEVDGAGSADIDTHGLHDDTVESKQQCTPSLGHARDLLLDASKHPVHKGASPQSITDTIRIGHTRPPPSRKSRETNGSSGDRGDVAGAGQRPQAPLGDHRGRRAGVLPRSVHDGQLTTPRARRPARDGPGGQAAVAAVRAQADRRCRWHRESTDSGFGKAITPRWRLACRRQWGRTVVGMMRQLG